MELHLFDRPHQNQLWTELSFDGFDLRKTKKSWAPAPIVGSFSTFLAIQFFQELRNEIAYWYDCACLIATQHCSLNYETSYVRFLYCIILKKNWKQLPLCKCCNCSFKHIGIGFIWLVRQEFRQGKSWKAICTSQIFDMLGAKEMRKRQ